MYNLDSHLNKSLDRFKIKDWCMKNLSTSEFWEYLNLDDSHRQIFEERFWEGYVKGYDKGHKDGVGSLADDPVD